MPEPRILCPGCGSSKVTVAEPFCQNCAVWLDDDPEGEG